LTTNSLPDVRQKRKREKMDKKKFKSSDFIDGIFSREVGGFIEMYRIGEEVRCDGHNQYFLNHGIARFCDINLSELLDSIGVKDLDTLKESLGQDWEQDALLAWFDMKCQSRGYTSRVNHAPFGTCEEALQMMRLLSGYQEDGERAKEDDVRLEISHTLTISTAHISPQTARLMDMDAIRVGFYSAGESGYHILTVGWENYRDTMPEDLKICVKYAAEHGCDWHEKVHGNETWGICFRGMTKHQK
jgi:hypothetical protein